MEKKNNLEPISHEGTPTQIMSILLRQANSQINNSIEVNIAIEQMDSLFMMFEEEFKHMTVDEQSKYIEYINTVFNSNIKNTSILEKSDRIIKFQLELFRWSSYRRGIIIWKKTKKYPDFLLDLEHMHLFAINYLKGAERVKYLKSMYERILRVYKFGETELKKYKKLLKEMLEDFELISEKEEVLRPKSIKATRQITTMDGAKFSADKPYGELIKDTDNVSVVKQVKPYLTSAEAMAILCIKKTKLYALQKQGILKPKKMGARKNLYPSNEIMDYIESRKETRKQQYFILFNGKNIIMNKSQEIIKVGKN